MVEASLGEIDARSLCEEKRLCKLDIFHPKMLQRVLRTEKSSRATVTRSCRLVPCVRVDSALIKYCFIKKIFIR
jgi:hypothetical protein